MINILVLDEHAIGMLVSRNATLENSWFNTFPLPSDVDGIKRVQVEDVLYLLSTQATEDSKLLVVLVGEDGIFASAPSPRHTFERLLLIALAQFDKTVSIPVTWKPFNDDSRLSVYAQPRSQGQGQRLYVDRNPLQTQNIYTYALAPYDVRDFDRVPYDTELFRRAYDRYADALLETPSRQPDREAFGITLEEPPGVILLGRMTLEEWYEKKLTSQQRKFVDRDHSAPVRLRGSAGTGKTLSMAIKCLRDAHSFNDNEKPTRIGFLTHSHALAHEVVLSMFYALDPKARWKNKQNGVWLGSLYELAVREFLQYEEKGLEPLSMDGRCGRELQHLYIDEAIEQYLSNPESGVRDLVNSKLMSALNSRERRNQLIDELMNEFAYVIDADGVRKGTPASEEYLSGSRNVLKMELSSRAERQVILDIHEEYCRELNRNNVLSMDQVVADFNRYLLSHEWSQLREREGFDVIFVDELHCFNPAERMIFHNLFKTSASENGKYPLFMAYDLKQGSTDAFLNYMDTERSQEMFKSINIGETKLVELTEVFRSTPEIAEFLKDLDGSFPALELGDDWGGYSVESRNESGDIPMLQDYRTTQDLLDDVFRKAQREARRNGGRQVAVLCMNDRLFGQHLKAGRIAGKYLAIAARDQVNEWRYAGKRCVFSTPEYVQGLQFQTVFLIHLDEVEIGADDVSMGARRRFISRCYLGASRAKTHLYIGSSRERGGHAHILNGPLQSGSLRDASGQHGA